MINNINARTSDGNIFCGGLIMLMAIKILRCFEVRFTMNNDGSSIPVVKEFDL